MFMMSTFFQKEWPFSKICCENNYLLNTIKCIYRNTKIRIKFNDGISEPIHINKGVRQGCGLSPVLL